MEFNKHAEELTVKNSDMLQTADTGMQLTEEQKRIIHSEGNIKINAVAGSGKTTTLIEYARARPKNARILYLAFNRSVKLEAQKKFADQGLQNVRVETAHSLAYRYVIEQNRYTISRNGYKTHEIAAMLHLHGGNEKHAEYIIANHIIKFCSYFCNSDKRKVHDLNYIDTVADEKAKNFVRTFYRSIEQGTRQLLSKMDKGEIDIPHDFYLKKFQLMQPELPYNYILFDEAQDASAAMLDIILRQKATTVIVGDTHQQIYGWRFAINSLEKVPFPTFNLSASFRFGQDIANLARDILSWKNHLSPCNPVVIDGKGIGKDIPPNAIIGRTNLGLLLKAIEFTTDDPDPQGIYFEGNFNTYTYADDGASLYDVLHLYNGNRRLIKDMLVRSMKNLEELQEYIEKTEDVQLGMMVEVIKEYGNRIPSLIKSLKEMQVTDEERLKAKMIFSTVHRAKGMEYGSVKLVNDFITESRLKRTIAEAKKSGGLYTAKCNEEINLLYVAITRTKGPVYIPEPLLPDKFPASPLIHIIKVNKESPFKDDQSSQPPSRYQKGVSRNRSGAWEEEPKSYSYIEKRKAFKEAYQPWTHELDQELREIYYKGTTIESIAKHFNRTQRAIVARLIKTGCVKKPKSEDESW